MSTILEATTIKELGVSKSDASKIAKLYNGTKNEYGIGARAIAEQLGVSRRKVMRTLEITGNAEFSAGSYT